MAFLAFIWLSLAAFAKPSALPLQKFTAHPMQCRKCHEKQYDFWESTKHASGYLALYVGNQHLDPECIGCHSLGYQHPGGFQKVRDTIVGEISSIEFLRSFEKSGGQADPLRKPYLEKIHQLEKDGKITRFYQGIQCEHCHGLRGIHPGGGRSRKVDVTTCRSCHIPERSPHFSPTWVAKVACPLGVSR